MYTDYSFDPPFGFTVAVYCYYLLFCKFFILLIYCYDLLFGFSLQAFAKNTGTRFSTYACMSSANDKRCGFEIKLGANQIDSAADGLLKVQKEILKEKDGNRQKFCVYFAACPMPHTEDRMVYLSFR